MSVDNLLKQNLFQGELSPYKLLWASFPRGHTKSITCFSDRPGRNSDPGGREKIKKLIINESHYSFISHIQYINANYSVVAVSDSDGIIKSYFAPFSPVRWLFQWKTLPTHTQRDTPGQTLALA